LITARTPFFSFANIVCTALILGAMWSFTHRQLRVEHEELLLNPATHQWLYKGRPFTGIALKRHLDGRLQDEENFFEGHQEGESFSYHHDGSKIARWFFVHDKLEGVQKGWYSVADGGGLRFERLYRDGWLEGESKTWRKSGQLMQQEVFAAGKKISEKIIFESGKIYSNYKTRDDRVYGLVGAPACAPVRRAGEL